MSESVDKRKPDIIRQNDTCIQFCDAEGTGRLKLERNVGQSLFFERGVRSLEFLMIDSGDDDGWFMTRTEVTALRDWLTRVLELTCTPEPE